MSGTSYASCNPATEISSSLDLQHRRHRRMERADIGELTLLSDSKSPGLVRLDCLGVENAILRRGGVRHQVLIDPDDRVAACDRQTFGLKPQAFDCDGIRLWFGPLSSGQTKGADDQPDERSQPCNTHGQPFWEVVACRRFACSRCATNAGRTFTSRALSSSLVALGISVLSSASITCWWYVTSRSMYALSNS